MNVRIYEHNVASLRRASERLKTTPPRLVNALLERELQIGLYGMPQRVQAPGEGPAFQEVLDSLFDRHQLWGLLIFPGVGHAPWLDCGRLHGVEGNVLLWERPAGPPARRMMRFGRHQIQTWSPIHRDVDWPLRLHALAQQWGELYPDLRLASFIEHEL